MLLEKASSGSENPNANQSECPLKEKQPAKLTDTLEKLTRIQNKTKQNETMS